MRYRIKQRMAPGLMVLSIVLLAAFQLFWLEKVYQEQYELLRKEASSLFADAVMSVEDSLVQRWVLQQLPENRDTFEIKVEHSSKRIRLPQIKEKKGAQVIIHQQNIDAEISGKKKMIRFRGDSMQQKEWVPGFLQSVLLKVQLMDSTGVFITSPIDSIRLWERIEQAFTDSLARSQMALPFKLLVNDSLASALSNHLLTPKVSGILPAQFSYQAALANYRPYLFRKILPQLLFSLFLLALTTTSFLFIYRSMQQQGRLAEMRNDLISNITHELKTPIATVSVALEAMENFNVLHDRERTREYLNMSRNELNRLSLLIDKVLKAAAFERKAIELHPEWVDLRKLLEEVLAYMKLQFEKQHARVSLQCTGEDFHLRADRIHLTNVIYNLIDNALKYSREDPVIALRLKNDTAALKLSIQDHGIGIPAQYQKRIFDKFFRVPQGDEHDTKGYGLGLSYVAKVVEKHNGTITVQSKPGDGSRFTITLPKPNTTLSL